MHSNPPAIDFKISLFQQHSSANLEEDKEKCFHKPIHRATHQHHHQEHHDVRVGQDLFDPLHSVTALWQTNVLIYEEKRHKGTEKHEITDHEGGDIVGGASDGSDLVHDNTNQGRNDGLSKSLVDNLATI